MPDLAALDAAHAVGYAGIGAVTLKLAEILLKTFGITKAVQDTERAARQKELESTLGAAAQMREELRKDNDDLRKRVRELESRFDALEAEYQTIRIRNEALKSENEDLRAELRLLRKNHKP